MSKWVSRKRPEGNVPEHWAGKLAITPLLLEILWRRGLTGFEAIDSYLSARLSGLTPPAFWPQIPQAAAILAEELLAGRKLAIWGDYDVDGITAAALALEVLEAHGFSALCHLPDRIAEGYGLNGRGIENLAARGCQTLLTVDCGISDAAAIARANELGMTVIVSDHHLPPAELPPARAIVNPRMATAGTWPCAHLAGVGVAFYLLAAVNAILASATGRRYKMDNALDLVALGTLADVMRLEGENRILVRGGLEKLARPVRPGMAALKEVSGFDRSAELTSGQAVFRLAPRINAAGRMGHARLALTLLRARNSMEAGKLARELDECNSLRKSEEERAHTEARKQAKALLAKKNYAALVLYGEDWHPGIVGIVASRIVEEHNRPTIVLCKDRDRLKGSGRTAGDFDLYAGLCQTAGCLLGFGGHKQAAGLSLEMDRLDEFRDAFAAVARAQLGEDPAEPVLVIDGELDFSQASNHTFLKELRLMQPFGPGNAEPVFSSPPLLVKKRSFIGHGHEHVMLHVEDGKSGITLQAKGWRMAGKLAPDLVNKKIYLAYTPRLEVYNSMPRVDLDIKDYKEVES